MCLNTFKNMCLKSDQMESTSLPVLGMSGSASIRSSFKALKSPLNIAICILRLWSLWHDLATVGVNEMQLWSEDAKGGPTDTLLVKARSDT